MRLLAVLALVSGCSFAFSRVPAAPARPTDCPSRAYPIYDGLFTLPVALGATAIGMWQAGNAPERYQTAAGIVAVTPIVLALGSVLFGFVQAGRCHARVGKDAAPLNDTADVPDDRAR